MKAQVNPIIVVVILVALVAGLAYYGWRAMSPHVPAGVSYEPGVPPWMTRDASGKLVPKQGGRTGGPPMAPQGPATR